MGQLIPWYLMAQGTGGGGTKTATGPVITFRGDGSPLLDLTVGIDPVQSGSGDPSPTNVRPIAGWSECKVWAKPTHDTTANPTVTIQLGQTVYGGTLDVLTGKLTVDRACKNLAVSESQITVTTTSGGLRYAKVPYSALGFSVASNSEVKSSEYAWVLTSATSAYGQIKCYGTEFRIYDERFTSASAAKAVLDTVQVLYPLSTTEEYDLTPQQISSLTGRTVLWADTGDVTAEYAVSGNPSLMKLAVAFMGEE